MRVMIDTNIFIQRENYHVLPEKLRELLKILNVLKVDILVHPKSIDEIRRDHDEERKKVALSKIQTYPLLESPPNPDKDKDFLNMVGSATNINDYIDILLLYAVYRDAVDFLISEDKGVHNRAFRANMKDRVLSSEEALTIFEKGFVFPHDQIQWYEKHPNSVTQSEKRKLFDNALVALRQYDLAYFYYNPGRIHPLYKALVSEMQSKNRKMREITHLDEILREPTSEERLI